MGKPAGQDEAKQASVQSTQIAQDQLARQHKIDDLITPYLTALTGLGFSPDQFAQSPLGQSLLGQMRGGISSEFGAARQNLAEAMGSSGMAGTGVSAGPLGALWGRQAAANANLYQQLPQIGLGLGLQGINALQGQAASYNPMGWMQTGIGGLNSLRQGGFWKNFTESLGSSLGNVRGGFQQGPQGTTAAGGFGG